MNKDGSGGASQAMESTAARRGAAAIGNTSGDGAGTSGGGLETTGGGYGVSGDYGASSNSAGASSGCGGISGGAYQRTLRSGMTPSGNAMSMPGRRVAGPLSAQAVNQRKTTFTNRYLQIAAPQAMQKS